MVYCNVLLWSSALEGSVLWKYSTSSFLARICAKSAQFTRVALAHVQEGQLCIQNSSGQQLAGL